MLVFRQDFHVHCQRALGNEDFLQFAATHERILSYGYKSLRQSDFFQ